jgi:HAD superfamily hydrolase (TIGR01493 family)
MKKAIIFDLYDTLITVKKKSKPYSYLLANCAVEPKAIINDIMLNDYLASGYVNKLKLYNKLKPTADTAHFLKLLDEEVESVQPFSDTYEVLRRLKDKYRLFCLSNLATPYKYPYYKLDMENYIEKAFFSCELTDKKPNASFYDKVVKHSGLNKEDFIMIGDNPLSDVKGAQDYGIEARLKDKSLLEITADL